MTRDFIRVSFKGDVQVTDKWKDEDRLYYVSVNVFKNNYRSRFKCLSFRRRDLGLNVSTYTSSFYNEMFILS